MRVNKFWMPVLALVPILLAVTVAQLTGSFATSGRDVVNMANMTSEDIRGWMTWQDVSDGFGIPLPDLYTLVGIPADIPANTAMKDMEGLIDGFETTTVREAVAAWLAGQEPQPVQTESSGAASPGTEVDPPIEGQLLETAMPKPAQQLATEPTVASTQPMPATDHVPQGDGVPQGEGVPLGDGGGTGPTPLPPGKILPASEIKGRHTLAEIADQCVIPLDALIAALNLPADTDPATQVKTLTSTGAVSEIDVIRDAVTALQQAAY